MYNIILKTILSRLRDIIFIKSRSNRENPLRYTTNNASSAGFTIVETLIVLSIAGLILLIVIEALPALERSGRNNQRKGDVSAILEAASRYELNDSGNFPQNCGPVGSACTASAGVSLPNDYFLQNYINKLTYYTSAAQVTLTSETPSNILSPAQQNPAIDQVFIYNYQKCDPTAQGKATPAGAGYNDVVALFTLEAGNGTTSECQQL